MWDPAGNTWRGYSRLVRQGTLGVDGRGWGPAGNTGRGWSWLRSGREHWACMVVLEVRQGTLGGDTRGWGPAGNTGHGWSRFDRDHCASRVAVEQEEDEEEEEEEIRKRGEEQATDIKSNNPHLAGGEKTKAEFSNVIVV